MIRAQILHTMYILSTDGVDRANDAASDLHLGIVS